MLNIFHTERMLRVNIIAAVDSRWGIGYKNRLLVNIPADQRFFRETTTGGVVVAGRKTMESLPGGQPLKNRTNFVLTRDKDYQMKGAVVVHSIQELLDQLGEYPSEQVYVIGGETIYRQLLPYCDTAHITKIDFAYQADTFFPDLDVDEEWEMVADSEEQTYYDLEYRFCKYQRIAKSL